MSILNIDRKDLRAIRWSLLCAVLLVVAWLVACWFVYHQHQLRERHLVEQQNLAHQHQQSYLSYREQNKYLQTLLPQYRQLIARGLVGEERRVEWLQTLRDAQQQNRHINDIQYSISPKSPYTASFLPRFTVLSLQRSLMHIEFDARHEGDIFDFMYRLSANMSPPFIWQACEFKRIGAAYNPQDVNVHAVCDLTWLTLREPIQMMGN